MFCFKLPVVRPEGSINTFRNEEAHEYSPGIHCQRVQPKLGQIEIKNEGGGGRTSFHQVASGGVAGLREARRSLPQFPNLIRNFFFFRCLSTIFSFSFNQIERQVLPELILQPSTLIFPYGCVRMLGSIPPPPKEKGKSRVISGATSRSDNNKEKSRSRTCLIPSQVSTLPTADNQQPKRRRKLGPRRLVE